MDQATGFLTKLREWFFSGALALGAAVLFFAHKRISALLPEHLKPVELAKGVVIALALLLLALAWVTYLYLRLAGRKYARDFEEYHPSVGVTVFRPKVKREVERNTDVWYCPRCLTVQHKLAHLNARHDSPGMWQCVECKLEVHCFSPRTS